MTSTQDSASQGGDDHRIALSGALLALGVALGVIESLYLPPLPVPGAKIGLSNVVTLLLVAFLPWRDALVNVVMRVVLTSLLTGGFLGTPMLFSSVSALCAFAAMLLAARLLGRLFSFVGISVFGAVASNLSQMAVAVLLLGTSGVLIHLPLLLVAAALGGAFTGAIANSAAGHDRLSKLLTRARDGAFPA